MEDQVSVFMSPSDGVAQLYAQAPGSLFVIFYDSQGYSGGILTCLHMDLVYYVVPIYLSAQTLIGWCLSLCPGHKEIGEPWNIRIWLFFFFSVVSLNVV
jgi:hypothetical protein